MTVAGCALFVFAAMLTIHLADEAPEIIADVQRFRGRIYLAEGAIAELAADGRHIEAVDETAYHLVERRAGEIRGCLRYQRVGKGCARVGGWAVNLESRGAGIHLISEAVALAGRLGDHYATATATVRNNSAGMLRRMGARPLLKYYDPGYRCEMELLEFHMRDFQSAAIAA